MRPRIEEICEYCILKTFRIKAILKTLRRIEQ